MKKIILLFLIAIMVSVLQAQDFNFISQFQGKCNAGESWGDKAYFNSGGNMHILDISNPQNISIVNEFHIGKQGCLDIHIKNDLMYLGIFGGIQIYSLEDQLQPELVGQIDIIWCRANKIFSIDSLLIAINGDWVSIYDVNDLANIQLLSSLYFAYDENAYCLNGNVFYGFAQVGFSGPHYLLGYDLSDPENPELVIQLELGGLETPWPDYFCSYNNMLFSGVNNTINVYDISIPDEISLIISFEIESDVLAINISDDVMQVSTESNGLILINISDIFYPEIVGNFDWDAAITDIFIDEDIVLLSAENNGFKVIDVSNHANIEESFYYDDTRAAWTIEVQNNVAYIGTLNSELYSIDISNNEEHVLLDQREINSIKQMELFESNLYCYSYFDPILHIVDVNDPSNLDEIGMIITDNGITDFCIQDGLLYLIETNTGIRVFDISTPAVPVQIAFADIHGYNLNVYENYLFLADSTDDYPYEAILKLFDIEDLNNFQLLSELTLGDNSDYSVQEIMLNFPDSPELFVGFRRGLASFTISSGQLQLEQEYMLDSGLFNEVYFDSNYIYCSNTAGNGDISIFQEDLNNGIIATIPNCTFSFGKSNEVLFLTHSDRGYSIYETPFSNINENIIPHPSSLISNLSNYPNPFNPSTTISFELNTENTEATELTIYNIKGQKIKTFTNDQLTSSPINQIVWNGKDDNGKQSASGIYFYKMKSGDYQQSRKMLLLK